MEILKNIKKYFFTKKTIDFNYEISREEFIKSAKENNATTIDQLIVNKEDDLTIDIAVFEGNNDSLILHISGTHGVEGFVGSEIQKAILNNYQEKYEGAFPTVIFVHGLNPFGMKYLRRVNENNVDLNRNALFSEDDWQENLNLPDLYKKINNTINPKYPYWEENLGKLYRICKMAKYIYKYGFTESKRSMVTGTYDKKYKKGLFYGGNSLEKSHQLLKKYLEDNNYIDNIKNLSIIDIHTGMGKMGKDTIMISSSNTYNKKYLDNLFNSAYNVCYTHRDSRNEVTKGYDLTRGDVADNYPKLFPNVNNIISVTQEFGTYHNILVALELIVENQCWHYGTKFGKYDNKNLYDKFSLLDDKKIRNEMIERGINLFNQVLFATET